MNAIASKKNGQLMEQENALIGYLLAGYPGRAEFLQLLDAVGQTALDAIEIGYPSKNPYGDGDTIQAAHRAVDHSLVEDMGYWQQIRNTVAKPIWLMAYKDDFITNGIYRKFARAKLMDAIVIPDCSHEEHVQLGQQLLDYQVDVVRFIRPTMSPEEIKRISADAPLLYGQLYSGPTGSGDQKQQNYQTMLEAVIENPKGRIYAGFGIDSREKVQELLSQGFHGTILGTALIKKLNDSPEELIKYLNQIKGAGR